jgi:hypothetical protein
MEEVPMQRLRSTCCGLVVLLLASCVSGPVEPEQTQSATQAVFTGTTNESCTTTLGVCKTGRCELGANDTVQIVTEVCCTPGGGCTTERYRLCGC